MKLLDLIRSRYADAGLPVSTPDGYPGFETECPACGERSLVLVDGERPQDVRRWCEIGCDADSVVDGLKRLTAGEQDLNGDQPVEEAPTVMPDEGVMTLRALFGALSVDPKTTALDPFEPLPGAPFLLPQTTALLAGPEGSGKSMVAQTIAYDVALAGQSVLYAAGEVTHPEFATRARRISETRDGELTDAAAQTWRERVAFVDTGDALPAIWRHPAAWNVVCGEYGLIVLDAVSDAGAALELKFSRDNDDWLAFFQGFVKPCQGRAALLMLDNIGHAEDARTRAIGAAAKGHKVDIRLSSRRREKPLSLVITAEKVRATRAPFRRGMRWVAYEQSCRPAVPFDATQIDLEREDAADPVAVVVGALQDRSPQGLTKLVTVLREAGVEGRNEALRRIVKAMAEDPDCPVRDTQGRGFELAPVTPELPVPQPVPQARARAPYTDGGTGLLAGTPDGEEEA